MILRFQMNGMYAMLRLVPVVLSCICMNAFAQDFIDQKRFAYYDSTGLADKKFVAKGKMLNGFPDGIWTDYFIAHIEIFRENGDSITFTSGAYFIRGEGAYVNGMKHGVWNYFLLEDKTFRPVHIADVTMYDDQVDGLFSCYYLTGELAAKGIMSSGLREGQWNVYRKSGELAGKYTYNYGYLHGPASEYYSNGEELKWNFNYGMGLLQGESVFYYRDGTTQEICTYDQGTIDGVYQFYYPNGQLWVERIYDHGKIMEINALFDQNGNARDFGNLKAGTGILKYYTDDGRIYMVETLESGVVMKVEQF